MKSFTGVDSQRLISEAVEAGYDVKTLAETLNISARKLNKKIEGRKPFTLTEIQWLKEILFLDNKTASKIFFDVNGD